jgi:glycosyltransferase 2 family protein
VPFAAAAVNPTLLTRATNGILRLVRREPVVLDLSAPVLRGALGWSALSWLLLGGQCWALIVGLGGPVGASFAPAVGGFALAYAAGMVFIPAPAGAGVREAVLGVALANVIDSPSAFDHDKVIVAVLLSRVLLAVLDFAQAGLAVAVGRRTHTATK